MSKQSEKTIQLTDRVEVIHTERNPHRQEGEKSKVAPAVAEKLRKKGWVK